MPVKLSVCLIIKNEEEFLPRCLQSVKSLADEIIIVDTGSSDRSITISRQFSDHVYCFDWRDDFSAARNFAMEKAGGEWIFMLDGDEELKSLSAQAILRRIESGEGDAFYVKIDNNPDGGEQWFNFDLALRLFKKTGACYAGAIHEEILDGLLLSDPRSKVLTAPEICILHHGGRETIAQNTERLKRNLNLIIKSFPTDTEQHCHLGIEYFRRHRPSEALDHFQLLDGNMKPPPSHQPHLLRCLAVCHYLLGHYQTALELIEQVWMPAFPEMSDPHFIKGVICKELGLYSRAYESFCGSLREIPAIPSGACIYCDREDQIYYYLGGLAEYFADQEKALSYYLESLKHNPYRYNSLDRIINILNPRRYPEYTVQALNQVFDLSDTTLQYRLAWTYSHQGAYRLALDCIGKLGGARPLPENISLLKGLCLLRSRQYPEAELELEGIGQNRELFIKARQYLMIYHWLQDDAAQVAINFEKIKQAGADPLFIEVLSVFLPETVLPTKTAGQKFSLMLKEILDFIVELGTAANIDKAWPRLFPSEHRPSRLLAETLYKYDKFTLAEEELRRLLATGNLEAGSVYYLSKSCWAQGNLEETEKYMRRAIQLGLNIPVVRWEMSRIYQELAIENLEQGLKDYPDGLGMRERLTALKDHLSG